MEQQLYGKYQYRNELLDGREGEFKRRHESLFDLIERTASHGKKTAKEVYHLNGWVSHHNVDIWGHPARSDISGRMKIPVPTLCGR